MDQQTSLIKRLQLYPESPGVYLMKRKNGLILYIGKAKNLRARIKQYYSLGGDGRWIIPYLQNQVEVIDTLVTLNEKEALLLENTLIKKHKPRYNALLKDDKTYTALKINTEHPWPMLSLIRYKGKVKGKGMFFGPYTSAYYARQTLDLLQKLFPLRQCSDQEFARRTRPCILYDMKRCTAPCVGLISKEAYQNDVDATIDFLSGKKESVLKSLKEEMERASENLEFEKAARYYQAILGIESVLEKQNVEQTSRKFSGDVLGIFRQGDEIALSELTFEEGQLNRYHHHHFKHILETDEELLESFLLQYYQDRKPLPKEVLLPLNLESSKTIEELIGVNLFVPQRGDKMSLIEMAMQNAKAAFHQKTDEESQREKALLELQERLHLSRQPKRIECIDTSHLSGSEAVSSLVSFLNGVPDKSRYRKFKLRNIDPSDDYGALREVLTRRFTQKEGEVLELPDLLIVDGGKGHLNAAFAILKGLNIVSVDVIGVAKEEGKHTQGATEEQIFIPEVKDPIFLQRHSQLLFLLQRIRDEAHRFAITYQKLRRSRSTLRSSLLDIPGIGPIKQKALLKAFGSVKQIQAAADMDILAVRGITKKDLEAIRKVMNDE